MTPSSEDLAALLARVEAATGPDRELDGALHRALHKHPVPFASHYTASLDAALALVERVLPGWNVDTFIRRDDGESCAHANARIWHPMTAMAHSAGGLPAGALALLSAMLKALIAKGGA